MTRSGPCVAIIAHSLLLGPVAERKAVICTWSPLRVDHLSHAMASPAEPTMVNKVPARNHRRHSRPSTAKKDISPEKVVNELMSGMTIERHKSLHQFGNWRGCDWHTHPAHYRHILVG